MMIQVLPFCFNTEEEEKNYTQGKVRKVGWVGMTSKMLGFSSSVSTQFDNFCGNEAN